MADDPTRVKAREAATIVRLASDTDAATAYLTAVLRTEFLAGKMEAYREADSIVLDTLREKEESP